MRSIFHIFLWSAVAAISLAAAAAISRALPI